MTAEQHDLRTRLALNCCQTHGLGGWGHRRLINHIERIAQMVEQSRSERSGK